MAANPKNPNSPSSNTKYPFQFTQWQGERDEIDEAALREHTLSMSNWTLFRPRDANPPSLEDRNYWYRLDRHNRDTHGRGRVDTDIFESIDNEYKLHYIETLSLRVGLTRTQTHEAFRRFMELDLQKAGLPMPLVAFAVCALVWNLDVERGDEKVPYHPQRKAENNPRPLQELAEHLMATYPRVTKRSLNSVYTKLSQGHLPRRPPNTWEPYFRHRSLPDPKGRVPVWKPETIDDEVGHIAPPT